MRNLIQMMKQIRLIKTTLQVTAFALVIVAAAWVHLVDKNVQWNTRTIGILVIALFGFLSVSIINSISKKDRAWVLVSIVIIIGVFISVLVLAIQDFLERQNHIAGTPSISRNPEPVENRSTIRVTTSEIPKSSNASIITTNESSFVRASSKSELQISLTSPADGAVVSNTVTVTASASVQNGDIASVEFYLLFGPPVGIAKSEPYAVNMDTTTIKNGKAYLYAIAYSSSGEWQVSGTNTIVISNGKY